MHPPGWRAIAALRLAAQYQGNLFSAQFNPHRVQRHILFREGATFRTEDSDFLTSRDPDFHPTDVIEDADGSLLVLDTGAWFIHGCPISRVAKPEIKGSIYRVRRTAGKEVSDPRGARVDLTAMTLPAVAKLLGDPRPALQDRAVEFLVEKGEAAVSALSAERAAAPSYATRAATVFALFRIGSAGALAQVRAALDDPDFRVRVAAARCAGMAGDREAVARLTAMARGDQPAARRQAIAALGQIGDTGAVPALLAAAADPQDRFVEHSIIYSLIMLRQPQPVVQALGDSRSPVRKAALVALDQMEGSPLESGQVARLLRAPDRDTRAAALWVVSHHPEWAEVVLSYLDERLHDPASTAREQDALRRALVIFSDNAGAQELVVRLLGDTSLRELQILFLLDTMDEVRQFPDRWKSPLAGLLRSPSPAVRMRTVELIRSRSLSGFEDQLASHQPGFPRARPVARVRPGRPGDGQSSTRARAVWLSAVAPQPEIGRRVAADGRARNRPLGSRPRRTAATRAHAPGRRRSADALDRAGVLRHVTRRSGRRGTAGRTAQIPGGAGHSWGGQVEAPPRGIPGQGAPGLGAAVPAAAGRAARAHRAAAQLEPLLTAGGDVGRGRRIFFGQKVACSSCHTIGAEGGHVGPDLTGVGAIRSGHDLLEAVVFPSASFVPGYEIYLVDIGNDRLSGVLRSQSRDAVVLVTGPHGEVRIPRSRIKSMERSTVSLMPDGFDESLSKTELTDLLAFLQAENTRPANGVSAGGGAR